MVDLRMLLAVKGGVVPGDSDRIHNGPWLVLPDVEGKPWTPPPPPLLTIGTMKS